MTLRPGVPTPRPFASYLAAVALAAAALLSPATSEAASARGVAVLEDVEVFFRNNKGWFKPITLIYYVPMDERGQVESRLLFPWQRFKMSLPTGTRVYIATAEQVERWSDGGSLRHLPPAMTIRPSDEGELYNLFR